MHVHYLWLLPIRLVVTLNEIEIHVLLQVARKFESNIGNTRVRRSIRS